MNLNHNLPHILDLTLDQWHDFALGAGEKKFRGEQVYRWLHDKRVAKIDQMQNLPAGFRELLKQSFIEPAGAVVAHTKDGLGNEKILFDFRGKKVEAVLLTNGERYTVCISTQAGCSLDCEFCCTGKVEFQGNLSIGEILEQVYQIEKLAGNRITNVVYMGMGEPFYNYDATIGSAMILHDTLGMNLAARRITISTAGVLPKIRRFFEQNLPFNLALSVHSFKPRVRVELMDVEKFWPLESIIDYLAGQYRLTGKGVTFEYVLIKDLNMGDDDAALIVKAAKKLHAKVNFIPLNFETDKLKKASKEEMEKFQREVTSKGVLAFNRMSQGEKIQAACGMLRAEHHDR